MWTPRKRQSRRRRFVTLDACTCPSERFINGYDLFDRKNHLSDCPYRTQRIRMVSHLDDHRERSLSPEV